ncbi:hypothetical protein ACNS7O_12090 [Haloferacaceae archaeon DSL9]
MVEKSHNAGGRSGTRRPSTSRFGASVRNRSTTPWLLGDRLSPDSSPSNRRTTSFDRGARIRRADGYEATYLGAETLDDGLDAYFEADSSDDATLVGPASHGGAGPDVLPRGQKDEGEWGAIRERVETIRERGTDGEL